MGSDALPRPGKTLEFFNDVILGVFNLNSIRFIMIKNDNFVANYFQVVYNITIEHEDSNLTYYDLCAKWNYNCYDNEILRLSDIIPSIEVGDYNLTYPITFHPETFEVHLFGSNSFF